MSSLAANRLQWCRQGTAKKVGILKIERYFQVLAVGELMKRGA